MTASTITVRSTQNAIHYTWGENCSGWHLLNTDTLSVIQECMPSGTSEQLHYHVHAQQLFYILAGTATFNIEGQTTAVHANESIHVPNGTKHLIANQGDHELKFLVISEPSTRDDRRNIQNTIS